MTRRLVRRKYSIHYSSDIENGEKGTGKMEGHPQDLVLLRVNFGEREEIKIISCLLFRITERYKTHRRKNFFFFNETFLVVLSVRYLFKICINCGMYRFEAQELRSLNSRYRLWNS